MTDTGDRTNKRQKTGRGPKYVFALGPGEDPKNKDHKIVCPICPARNNLATPVTLVARMMRLHFSRSHRNGFHKYFDGEPSEELTCPYAPSCGHKRFIRHAEVMDHLNEAHNEYDEAWGLNVNKMKRKPIHDLIQSFAHEAAALNNFKRRIFDAEFNIMVVDPEYVSVHGLDLINYYEENQSLVTSLRTKREQKLDVAERLVQLRHEARAMGKDLAGVPSTWIMVTQQLENMFRTYADE